MTDPVDRSERLALADFCRGVLERGDLAAKLTAPPDRLLAEGDDRGHPPVEIAAPAREAGLRMGSASEALPRPGELSDPAARALCLARFAHHELMAVELFAWALLRWPDLPGALQRDWLRILSDEQRHCRLYLERLAAHSTDLARFAPHSGYFWRQAPAIAASPHGPRAFLAAMGLTLEQANLDFTLRYRDAFRAAGDEASARVCQRVHDDEVGHVGSAARWLAALAPTGGPRHLTALYEAAVPFPLSAARAKGRRFEASARRRAGLEATFVEYVRRARSSQESGARRRRTPV